MIPFLDHDQVALVSGDCRRMAEILAPSSIDAILTDPPYELGFMGKAWDKSGIAFDPTFWIEVLGVLKPGGHLLAFSGARTSHRMVCAIEDAGFEIRDSIHWTYGTGFPKSLNLPEGRGTALKPAHEPVCLARKPLAGTVLHNVERFSTGALNIDAARIPRGEGDRTRYGVSGDEGPGSVNTFGFRPEDRGPYEPAEGGRWPANLILDEEAAELFGDARSFFYCAKPTRAERDHGCESLPPREGGEATDREEGSAGLQSPRAGAGRNGGHRNSHPTVKPQTLLRYLVRLITPPGGTVLDPFLGSGSTAVAALSEGLNVVGFEISPEYCAIAKARVSKALEGLICRETHDLSAEKMRKT